MTQNVPALDALEPLLEATARGDQAAFARLYAATSPQLFGLLLRMLQRRDWAEEALQDCYVRIWQKSESYAPEREGLGRLDDCMKGLAREQRESVLLAYYEGYTHSELAKRLDAPMGTVKSWVRRGLMQLRDCLGAA